MRVLVVDPNEAFATLLSEELKREGYEIDMCLDGTSALAAARRHTIDLAVLDMALVGPDALVLAQQLRNLNANLRLMLIPLMGETLPSQAMSLAVQGVLPKPFFLPELPGLIQAALRAPLAGGVITSETAEPTPVVAESVPPPVEEGIAMDEGIFGPEIGAVPARETKQYIIAPPVEMIEMPLPEMESVEISQEGQEGTAGLSYDAFSAHRLEVERLMNALVQDVGADAVLLTFGGGLLTYVGGLAQAEAESISRAIVHGWRTSAEVARILGREQVRFEQSISGDDYMLYALSVEVNAIMGVAVRGAAPLGLLRHHARATAERIAQICKV
ncbi:MAG TPA: response regulator [Anaerolineae bacterium]|nr:response regulator [Anaerolineae bacterium]HQH37611.1 response regulator [Anaerolineae bacterium]